MEREQEHAGMDLASAAGLTVVEVPNLRLEGALVSDMGVILVRAHLPADRRGACVDQLTLRWLLRPSQTE